SGTASCRSCSVRIRPEPSAAMTRTSRNCGASTACAAACSAKDFRQASPSDSATALSAAGLARLRRPRRVALALLGGHLADRQRAFLHLPLDILEFRNPTLG